MPPAALAIMHRDLAARSISDAEVELALDLQPFLDQDAADLLAGGARLIGDELHADHVLRRRLRPSVGVLDDLDAAALAAATGVNLRFDDDHAAAEAVGDLAGFRRR